jgi:DNA-binding NarL/FixJ family response regulator
MDKIHIVIVDDHRMFRDGLKFILNEMQNTEVIGEASNGIELLDILRVVEPDIVILDINMPVMNGIEASKEALKMYPDLKILVLSMFGDDQYYNQMIENGVKGFILKDSDNYELKNAVQAIVQGNTYFSQELLLNLIKNKKETGPHVHLTKREYEVLSLICKGKSTNEISEQLHISQRTVERHRSNLLIKTDSPNSIGLVIYAIKNNLVEI